MGAIVFAAAMSHAPHITAFPERATPAARKRIHGAMMEAGEALRVAGPDLVVTISSDHFTNLFVDRMPAFCVGVGEKYRGPVEDWLGMPSFSVPGHARFAHEILHHAYQSGLEPAFAASMEIEHGIAVPLSFLCPDAHIPIVPVLQNCMVPPLPTLRRCHELGTLIRQAALASSLRVAVVGMGGLSHAPGAPEAGAIDRDFDELFLAHLVSAAPEAILDIPDSRIDAAGFGTWEVRQWATALGAAANGRASVLAYEAIEEWETGCAVALFKV